MNGPGFRHKLAWDRGAAEIWALSAALHHLEMRLDDGRVIRPLAEAPWHDDAATTGDMAIAAHLRFLGGEWPCVPFGRSDADPVIHGFGTDNKWSLVESAPGTATLRIDYPEGHAISRLERTVSGAAGSARVDFTLTATARQDAVMPVGLHPILRLGEGVQIEGRFAHGETFPTVFEPGVSRLAVATRFADTGALPLAEGGTVAFSDLLAATGEEAFQLFGVDGRLAIAYPRDSYRTVITWDEADFPTCLFWISTGGRRYAPWNGRFRGFGLEPLAARFADRLGSATIGGGRAFAAGQTWTTRYAIAVEAL